jgi:two-component system phosphate regulon response regulator PhoB
MGPVFVVEDDLEIAGLMRYHLEHASYAVQCYTTTASAFTRAKEVTPSLFILDVMLPGENGFDFCRRLRREPRFANTAVIFVTAKAAEADRVLGLDLGADDYITKPFSPREFMARVNAVMRRSAEPMRSALKFGDIEIDFDAMMLRVNGVEQETTAMEFRILATLARSPERVFSREHLLRLCGTNNEDVSSPRSIDVYISRLREKLDTQPDRPSCLRTVRGVGYMFVVQRERSERLIG